MSWSCGALSGPHGNAASLGPGCVSPAAWIFSSRNEFICLTGFGGRFQARGLLFNKSFTPKALSHPVTVLGFKRGFNSAMETLNGSRHLSHKISRSCRPPGLKLTGPSPAAGQSPPFVPVVPPAFHVYLKCVPLGGGGPRWAGEGTAGLSTQGRGW